MPKAAIAILSVLVAALWTGPAKPAMTDKDKAELATAVLGAKVTLEQGLLVSKKNGKPGFRQVRNREREAPAIRVYC
jgi:hypothetical protein